MAKGDAAVAREAFARVVAERPQQLDARAGLAHAGFALGDPGALRLVDEVLGEALGGTTELLRVTLEELGPAADALALGPATAWRIAQRLDAGGDHDGVRPYYEVASRADGLMGLKARVRGLELDPEPAIAALRAAADLTAREPELQKRVTVLLRKHQPEETRSIELSDDDTHLELELRPSLRGGDELVAARPPPPPVVVPVRLEARTGGGLVVVTPSGTSTLPWRTVLGLAAGFVPTAGGRFTVLTDLVIGWAGEGRAASVLRASLGDLGLDRLYPGVPPREAHARLLEDIAQASGAKRLPPGTGSGNLPRYAGPEEMTRVCHGTA